MNAQYDSYFYGYRTPPYVTANPDVGTMQLEKGGFAIMASDGLWDLVTSEEAARIVRRAIDQGEEDLAKYLFQAIRMKVPGDDVTILVLKV
jgi:pyruvate dehydrogenase phosphatase